jgi:hypothetical protein
MTRKIYDSVGRNYNRHSNVRIKQVALERNRYGLNNIKNAAVYLWEGQQETTTKKNILKYNTDRKV